MVPPKGRFLTNSRQVGWAGYPSDAELYSERGGLSMWGQRHGWDDILECVVSAERVKESQQSDFLKEITHE